MHGQELLVALVTMGAAVAIGVLVGAAAGTLAASAAHGAADAPSRRGRSSWAGGLAKTRGNLARRLLDAWTGGGGPRRLAAARRGDPAQLRRRREGDAGAARAVAARGARRADAPASCGPWSTSAVRTLLIARRPSRPSRAKPEVILVVGVNGVGKTTTIGKLAHRYRQAGRTVLVVAADTFRAAAIEQLARVGGARRRRPGQAPARRRSVGGRLRRGAAPPSRAARTWSSSTPPADCT